MPDLPHLIYHADDLDGRGSAAIALRALLPREDFPSWEAWRDAAKPLCHPVSYNQPVPELPPGCKVYLLDFSFEPKEMAMLCTKHQLCYIDHHAPRIADLRALGLLDECLLGAKLNPHDGCPSAIHLAWEYFNPEREVPTGVQYLSLYDAAPDFLRKGANWTGKILPYQHGLRSYPTDPWDPIWHDVFSRNLQDLDRLIDEGKAILRSRAQTAALFGPRSCQLVLTTLNLLDDDDPYREREYSILAGNGVGEDYFPHHPDYHKAELLLCYRYEPTCQPPKQWKCTIWPGPAAPADFDCGQWAKDNYQGGGHKGVAGFHLSTDQLPIP